jgi:hypothetical protein
MQWILQNYEDTSMLAETLTRQDVLHSFHKVIPFVGELLPEPVIEDPSKVVMFGSYSLRYYARKHGLTPGVFELRPFYDEKVWDNLLLNGPHNSTVMTVRRLAGLKPGVGTHTMFIRPLQDSKEIAGAVMTYNDVVEMCQNVMALEEHELIRGSLGHDTEMILSTVSDVRQEWRLWVVEDRVVTYSLYKQGGKVMYLPYIDDDALEFARHVIEVNPYYSPAYVLDVCRTDFGLHLLETNCINAAGLYAADLNRLVGAIENMKV